MSNYYFKEKNYIQRYFKIFKRTYNENTQMLLKKGFTYNSVELEKYYSIHNQPVNYTLEDKLFIAKNKLFLDSYENVNVIEILKGVKFEYEFKNLSFVEVHLYKTGELKIKYTNNKIVDNPIFSLYLLEDFIEKYQNIDNFLNFIFEKYLIPQTTLELLENKILAQFPNYSSLFGMPDTKKHMQKIFKDRILLNFLSDKKSNDIEEKHNINSFGFHNCWDEKLPCSLEIEKFLTQLLMEFPHLTKFDIIEEHLNKLLLFTHYTLNNVEKQKVCLYAYINDYYDILGGVKMLSDSTKNKILESVKTINN